jgi:hypothetical protein
MGTSFRNEKNFRGCPWGIAMNSCLRWSPKITLPRFMDVLRTYLLIAVSDGAQKITLPGFFRCPSDMPINRRLRWSPNITLPRFMDVLRTFLLIDVSSGAQSPKHRRFFLNWSLKYGSAAKKKFAAEPSQFPIIFKKP